MSKQDSWGSRVGLILAMAGNAVGLGNFLRFPVQAVQNGGGTFIIPYLVSFLLMGIPLLWVEWAMGRYGGRNGDHSTPFILDSMTKKRLWKYFGVFGIFTNLGVMAYYTYIESWTLSYTLKSAVGGFSGKSIEEVGQFFDAYIGSGAAMNLPTWAFLAFVITLVLNIYILSKGLSGGIEKVAKIAMPLLILFGVLLAIKAIFLGQAGDCADCDSRVGMNFLWEPDFSNLWDPKIWLAAAGQIFFTLSVGMGTIHCYASYVKKKDDIALNAMSAGWMNGFVEIVLGASVVIPIAVGYLGLDWVKENAGFMMAFKTMPYLFDQWGTVLSSLAGIAWFGLLFFAGVTSSLAMGTPWMGFMKDEFNWDAKKSAIALGILIFFLALPTIFFFDQGVFDEYDYWTGTVSLVVFALAEVILFAWVFGMDKGWNEIVSGADIRVPRFYRFIIKYVTPLFIGWILFNSLFKQGSGEGFNLAPDSIIGQIVHIGQDIVWYKDDAFTKMFYVDMSRLVLLSLFAGLCIMVRVAQVRRDKKAKSI
jgi:SNF family Na+-dependent transporter